MAIDTFNIKRRLQIEMENTFSLEEKMRNSRACLNACLLRTPYPGLVLDLDLIMKPS
jgi:hypothetical protein